MGFAVRVRSAGQKYGPACHQRDRADVTEFVTLVRLSSLGQHLASWRWQDINVGNPLWWRTLFPVTSWHSTQTSAKHFNLESTKQMWAYCMIQPGRQDALACQINKLGWWGKSLAQSGNSFLSRTRPLCACTSPGRSGNRECQSLIESASLSGSE